MKSEEAIRFDENGRCRFPVRVLDHIEVPYTDEERNHLPADCRGYLLALERSGILSPQQREIVIERLLALDASELDVDQLKWVVLMVLSSQPGEELACARMEDLVFDLPPERPH